MRVGMVAMAAALAVGASGCGGNGAPGTQQPTSTTAVPAIAGTPGPALPSGWRWESFMSVELAVPGSWGYGTTGSPWCIAKRPITPYVGRPGPVPGVGCAASYPKGQTVDPGLLAANGVYVWFSPDVDTAETGTVTTGTIPTVTSAGAPALQGDRLTLHQDGAEIDIQAPKQVREQIAATVHTITVDQNGCPVTHPVSGDPAWRPAGGAERTQFPDPEAVSACRYVLIGVTNRDRPKGAATLISSVRVTGAAAGQAASGLDTAVGTGPNAPQSCSTDSAYGDEVIVLRITGRAGLAPREVVLRYSGCDHHGFDNGDAVRRLTAASVAPFITGPNQVNSFSTELSAVLRPKDPGRSKG